MGQEPLRWNALAAEQGHRRSVFCASMADVFEEHPQVEAEREKLWPLIRATPWLNWLLLTKRPFGITVVSLLELGYTLLLLQDQKGPSTHASDPRE